MREDEPLEGWLFLVRLIAERGPAPQLRGSEGALGRLAQAIADQPAGKTNYGAIRGGTFSPYANVTLGPGELAEAQRLFLGVWDRGGAGSSFVMEGLLHSIAMARQPASVPFWQQQLDLSRPRDQSTTRRRTYALAALALLAITEGDTAAYAALSGALTHPHEQVRALGAFYLAKAYAVAAQPMPAPVAAALADLATHDRAFAPRFQARRALRMLGHKAPLDPPDQVYFLKVQLRGDKATRTIAISTGDMLDDLHYAIQRAFGWDADHLYSFFMSGDRSDRRYEIRCPELDDDWGASIRSITIVGKGVEEVIALASSDVAEGADDDDDDDELYTSNTQIGALGLVPKHTFIYFFDYGDSHQFTVTVLGVEERTDDGTYPRVVESRGNAPQQYDGYEDEEP
ncbi:plasmid pRiA4b ORF-3 family protein [Oscillochloris sp. ZM17-4]|uniref:plasmid pRiA4b ORF-3 family protein n=1 Tax=Oscillochloris sp. ZM17-4 TaxID=2866714 RepID=UPI001C736250|nr:plasmid pRiA4b ORF-3 family protein [Oscillochloris sp. ZM17-4]MBX0331303.1 plasmid pRiA4b ORF-3 family protein [Oscillochloris sp. ZM17-4]